MGLQLDGVITPSFQLEGVITPSFSLSGDLEVSSIREAEILLQLAAAENGKQGEQLINITTVGSIVIVVLPLLGAPRAGVLGLVRIVLRAKTHTTPPTSIDLDLIDDDTAITADLFVQGGGSKTIAQRLTAPIDAVVGAPLAVEESLVGRGFAARRTFFTKGTSGSIALAFRVNGGSGIDYDMIVQVTGKKLAT